MGKGIVGIIKFVLGILLLPVVVAITLTFYHELPSLGALRDFFIWGMFSYVIMHLFVFTPQGLYQAGQKVFNEIFSFFPGAAMVVPLIIPLLPTMILLVLYICQSIFKVEGIEKYFVIAAGFVTALHLILTAQDIYDEDSNALKPRYIFTMSLVYIVNICIIVLLLGLNFEKFSIPDFFQTWWLNIQKCYAWAIHAIPGF